MSRSSAPGDSVDGGACMLVLEHAGVARSGCLFNIGVYLWRMGDPETPLDFAHKALWFARHLHDRDFYGVAITPAELEAIDDCASRARSRPANAALPELANLLSQIESLLRAGVPATPWRARR